MEATASNARWRKKIIKRFYVLAALIALVEFVIFFFDEFAGLLFLPIPIYLLRFFIFPTMINFALVIAGDKYNRSTKNSEKKKDYMVCLMCLGVMICVECTHYVFAPVLCTPMLIIYASSFFGDEKITRRMLLYSLISLIPSTLLAAVELRKGDNQLYLDVAIAAVIMVGSYYVAKIGIRKEEERIADLIEVYQLKSENVDLGRSLDMIKRANGAAEQARQAAERANKAKSIFLANMSHEIRTPMNAIIGMNEITIRDSKEPATIQNSLDIRQASNTLLTLINDILDLSRVESGKLTLIEKEYDAKQMLRNIIIITKQTIEGRNIRFTVDIDKNMPYMLVGDELRIRQIILNLLSNAVKYTREGDVILHVGHKMISGNSIEMIIKVVDTGIGIKAENIPVLFDFFNRLEEEKNKRIQGTGLGLAIVKQLVELMQGGIKVNSIYNAGSTFEIRIPQVFVSGTVMGDIFDADRSETIVEEIKKQKYICPTAHILVVDDNLVNLKVIDVLLRRTRASIDTAASGRECLKMAARIRYDIIFMDHMMPEMDGIEVLQKLRSDENGLNADTPVIALTANAIAGMREMYLKKGFSDYLSKPVEGAVLEEQLFKHLPKELIRQVVEEKSQNED